MLEFCAIRIARRIEAFIFLERLVLQSFKMGGIVFYAGRSKGVFVSMHTNRRRGDMSLDLQYGDSSPELHHQKGPAIKFARKKSVTYTTVEISNEHPSEKVRLVQGLQTKSQD